MIGIDTNVLVRFLAQDDASQSPIATRFIASKLTVEQPGFISLVVLAETAWVLRRTLRIPANEVMAAIEGLLMADAFIVQSADEVQAAVARSRRGEGGFTDSLIAELAMKQGCVFTYTFDAEAAKRRGFRLL